MLNTTGIPNCSLIRNDVTTEEFLEADDWNSVHSYNLAPMIFVCFILGAIILGTILGNIFVISAILLEKSLRATTSNYLILSLAATDLMLAVFVLPISIENQITVRWRLRKWVCDMWTSLDVLCCTASILHLLTIAVNRYLSVTYVGYTRRLSTHKIVLMIAMVWWVSFCISVPPLFGWRDRKQSSDFTGRCVVSQTTGYVLFASLGAFFIPLIFIIILNLKIYLIAKDRVKNVGADGSKVSRPSQSDTTYSDHTMNATLESVRKENSVPVEQTRQTDNYLRADGQNTNTIAHQGAHLGPIARSLCRPNGSAEPSFSSPELASPITTYNKQGCTPMTPHGGKTDKVRRIYLRKIMKEKRTATVLAIITGAFVFCWLPFFVVFLIGPFCKTCHVSDLTWSLVTWLGYFNSMVNPVIYTVFNRKFRKAFRDHVPFRKSIRKGRATHGEVKHPKKFCVSTRVTG